MGPGTGSARRSRDEVVTVSARSRLERAPRRRPGCGHVPWRAGTDGQASIEWLALVGARRGVARPGDGAGPRASDVGRQVTREMARALCRVGPGRLRARPRAVHADLRIAAAAAGAAQAVRRPPRWRRCSAVLQQRSDGTIAVTRGRPAMVGIGAGIGLSRGSWSPHGHRRRSAAGLSAAYCRARRSRPPRTWIVSSRAAGRPALASTRGRSARTTGLRPPRRAGAAATARRRVSPIKLGTEADDRRGPRSHGPARTPSRGPARCPSTALRRGRASTSARVIARSTCRPRRTRASRRVGG